VNVGEKQRQLHVHINRTIKHSINVIGRNGYPEGNIGENILNTTLHYITLQ